MVAAQQVIERVGLPVNQNSQVLPRLQYSLEDLASEQPVTYNRDGIQELTLEQLSEGEKILNSVGGNTSGSRFRPMLEDRW